MSKLDDYKMTPWERVYWPVRRLWRDHGIGHYYYEAKYFIQRGRRGWSDRDWWDTHYYLSEVIPSMLRKYAKDGIGYPAGFGDSGGNMKSIASSDDNDDEWKKNAAAWHEALLKAADDIEAYFKFEEDTDNYPEQGDKKGWEKHFKQKEAAVKRTKRGMKFVADNFFDLWD